MSKDLGKIIIIEGIWRSGKTTLIKNMQEIEDIVAIDEPSHLCGKKFKNIQEITKWYLAAHYKNLDMALKLAKEGKIIVIERSPFSSLAFKQVYFNNNNVIEDLRKLERKLHNIKLQLGKRICIKYVQPKDLDQIVKTMKVNSHIKDFSDKRLLMQLDKTLRRFILLSKKKELIDLELL